MLNRLLPPETILCQSQTLDTLAYDLSGSRFEITLPPQDYEFPEDDNGQRFNLFDPNLYRYNSEPDRNGQTEGRALTGPLTDPGYKSKIIGLIKPAFLLAPR